MDRKLQDRVAVITGASRGIGFGYRRDTAKRAAREAASFVCDEAMQVCGVTRFDEASGLRWLYGLSRSYRIAGGASELHRNMIARDQVASSWTFNDKH